MSERKVLTKYYPPDWDPRQISRKKGPKVDKPLQTVRLMAPFSMKCTSCGEFIGKGRKFNSRKETPTDEKYLNIQIHYFHIKCTRCSSPIVFRTDPKNTDYKMVKGAIRNMEPWHNKAAEQESLDDKLDRLEKEEAEAAGEEQEEKNAMADLEARTQRAREEIEVADALDRIRMQNAARARASGHDVQDGVVYAAQEKLDEEDRLDAEAARRAFENYRSKLDEEIIEEGIEEEPEAEEEQEQQQAASRPKDNPSSALISSSSSQPSAVFAKKKKQKKNYAGMLGIKGKKA